MPLYASEDARKERAQYLSLKAALWAERSPFDSVWRELGDQFQPRRTRFQVTDRNQQGRVNQKIYDSTGRQAVRTLQSGLHAGLTSPARPWMRLTTPDPDLAEFPPVQDWLHIVTLRILSVFQQTNLYQSLPVLYGDIGVFGTGAMSILPDTRDVFRTFTYPIGSYAIGLDKRRLVTTWVHEYEMTVRQVVEEFGLENPGSRAINWTNISKAVKKLWDKGQYEEPVSICWMVVPNTDRKPDRLRAFDRMPWRSYHFESGGETDTVLRRSGFEEFPVMVPRWDVTGEDSYGTSSPGIDALQDSKQLQSMQRHKGRAIAKMIDPPLRGPAALAMQKTSLLPGDITYVDERDSMKGLGPIHEVTLNIQHLREDIYETQYRVKSAFYEPLFLMLSSSDPARGAQPVTAREIEERHEEKLLALGPVLERTNDELLDPLVDRVYAMMERAGLLPDPPEELNGQALKVEYTSIMASAQKLVGVVGADRLLQTMPAIIELWPEARHKVDPFRLVDNYGEMLGGDPRVIVSTEEAMAKVEEERAAAATAQSAQNMQAFGKAAKDMAAAPLSEDTALGGILAGAAGAMN